MRTYDEKVITASYDYLVVYSPAGRGDHSHIVIESLGSDYTAGSMVVLDMIIYWDGTKYRAIATYVSEDFDLNVLYGHIDSYPHQIGIAVRFSYTPSNKILRLKKLYGSGELVGVSGDVFVSEGTVDFVILSGEGAGGKHVVQRGSSYLVWGGDTSTPYLTLHHEYDDSSPYKTYGSFVIEGGGMVVAGDSAGWLSLIPVPVRDYAIRPIVDEEGFTIFFDSANSNSGGALRWYNVNEGGSLDAYVAFNENLIMYVYAHSGWRLYLGGGIDSVPPDNAIIPTVEVTDSLADFLVDIVSQGTIQGAFKSSSGNPGVSQHVIVNDGDGSTVHHFVFEDGILVNYYTS